VERIQFPTVRKLGLEQLLPNSSMQRPSPLFDDPVEPFSVQNIYRMIHIEPSQVNIILLVTFALGSILYLAMSIWYEVQCFKMQETRLEDTNMLPLSVRGQQRDPVFDFLKGTCMFCVVAEHMSEVWFKGSFEVSRELFGAAVMPAFATLSGIFSASINKKQLLTTVIGLPCAMLMFDFLLSMTTVVTRGSSILEIGSSGVMWYLECLVLWRLTASPLFHVLGKYGVPTLAIYGLVCILCGMLLAICMGQKSFNIDSNTWFIRAVPVYYMTFFSLGLTMTADRWSNLFANRRLRIIGTLGYLLWYASVCCSSDFRNWAVSTCIGDQCALNYFIPVELLNAMKHKICHEFFQVYAKILLQKIYLIFCFLMLVTSLYHVLENIFGKCSRELFHGLVSYGQNTLFGYLLHWIYLILGLRCTCGLTHTLTETAKMSSSGPIFLWFVKFPLALSIYFAVTSKLSAKVFGFLLQGPVWMMEFCGLMNRAPPGSSKG